MCTAVTRSYHDDVLISIMAKADEAAKGKTDWLWLYVDGELRCLELRLNDSIASISIDGKYIFAAGIDQDKNTIFCILDRNGKLLTQVQMKNERTFPVRIPKWTPTGNKIVWTKDSLDHEVLLLDRHTLSILDAIKWPDISIAFSSTGWVAIAGKKGIALPQEAFNEAVKELGCMSVELEKQRFETYKQSVSERKELLHKSLNLRENTD